MLERKWLGDKTKGGFYKKVERRATARKTSGWRLIGRRWNIVRGRSRSSPRSIWRRMSRDTGTRLRMLLGLDGGGPQKGDKAGAFLWAALCDLWTYSANRVPEISDSIVEIDRAMQLGFNWELGPFELWDAAGVEATVARMKKEGKPVAANVEKLLASGRSRGTSTIRRSPSGRKYLDLETESLRADCRYRRACGRSRWRRNRMEW